MTPNQIKQITVKGQLVGITGWKEALKKVAPTYREMTDDDIKQALLDELSSHNYIPSGALNDYGRALLREFKIEQGLPVEEEPVLGLHIAVLGMSCPNCTRLETDVRELLAEMNIAADLRHITDPKQIASYGVMGTPALIINNKVVSVGEVPPKSKIRQFIIDAYPTPDK